MEKKNFNTESTFSKNLSNAERLDNLTRTTQPTMT
jgi:hypothetical protein